MARLAQTVILWDDEAQAPVIHEAGSEPDERAAALITNPKAWAPDEEPTPEGDDTTAPAKDKKPKSAKDKKAKSKSKSKDKTPAPDSTESTGGEPDGSEQQDDDDSAGGEPDGGESSDSTRPEAPRKNASRDDWAAHAKALGFEVSDDATRAEIIAAVEADATSTDA